MDQLEPDGEALLKWKSELCRVLPDAWNSTCAEQEQHNRDKRFIGEASLAVGIAAHIRITLLQKDMTKLGTLVTDALTDIQKQQREYKIMVQLNSIAEEWRVIGRTGRAPDQFWSPETVWQILAKLEIPMQDRQCYRAARVFESLSTIRIIRHHAFPRLRVEVRLNVVEPTCGRLLKELRHIGEFQGGYFGWKAVPHRGIINDRQLIGVQKGGCRPVRLNTYHCEKPSGQRLFKDDSCEGDLTDNSTAASDMTTLDRGCTWNWLDTRAIQPCLADVARDDDREMIYLSTTCRNYTIHTPTDSPRTYDLSGPSQLVIKLITNQVLVVGNTTVRSKGVIWGKMERIQVFKQYDPTQWNQSTSRLRGWLDQNRHSLSDYFPLPPAQWLPWIIGTVALIACGSAAWCAYRHCSRARAAAANVAVYYHAPARGEEQQRKSIRFLRTEANRPAAPSPSRFRATPVKLRQLSITSSAIIFMAVGFTGLATAQPHSQYSPSPKVHDWVESHRPTKGLLGNVSAGANAFQLERPLHGLYMATGWLGASGAWVEIADRTGQPPALYFNVDKRVDAIGKIIGGCH